MSPSIPRTSGIYKIICTPTGKVYIGSAVNLYERWHGGHLPRLRADEHHSRHLQNAWNKYGEDAFVFEVIELVLSPFLLEREQYHLDRTKAYDDRYGMNISPSAQSRFGVKVSEETRARMREAKRTTSEETRAKLRDRVISPETRAKIGALRAGKPAHPNSLQAIVEHRADEWEVTDPEGTTFLVKNLTQFCRDHGLSFDAMKKVADTQQGRISRHSQYQHRGWVCRRKEK